MGLRSTSAMLALAVAIAGSTVISANAADAPGTMPAATQARSQQAIVGDLRATSAEMHQVIPSMAVIADEDGRKGIAEKAIPVVRKMSTLLGELAGVQEQPAARAGITEQQFQFKSFLVAFGDKEAVAELQAAAKELGSEKSVSSQSALILGEWWSNSKDAAAQSKLLEQFSILAKANPSSDNLASTAGMMTELGAANATLQKQATEIIRSTLTSRTATQILAQADAKQAQKDLEGKPVVVAGRTTTGTQFTSAEWKGKVILVDMWATWCGPCKAELPRTKKLYDDYHAKGLELVGLDCDTADDTVNAFIKENAMAWPQLRELSQNESQWHPLATQWHVQGIPTMFLIDRKGILRYVDGREDTETKVKALLAETDSK